MCPQFERMKAIFGEKANVTLSATLELGVPSGQTPQREHGESTASKAKRKEPPSKKKKAANLLKSSKHQKLDESSSKKAGPRICEEILMR
ncbi:hypothetical protein GQ600_14286 [Phytophthora cactorum]|nr:hypothetical protein GQ600_14286 [Phytophthora cactorum]